MTRSRSRRAALLVGAAFLLGGASAPERYLGISLGPGGDPELQALARGARGGDPVAQIGLARRFEEGGRAERAEPLYLAASTSGATDAVRAEARAGWIRVRSDRMARRAAERRPGGFSNEIYYARKLMLERELGDARALALPITSIAGPVTISGRFEEVGFERGEAELCGAMAALIRRYRPWGFENCVVEHHRRAGRTVRGEPRLVSISYDESNGEDPNFQGHPHEFSWPPYRMSASLGGAERPLCGRFSAYDFVLVGGARYRVIHAAAAGEPEAGRGCRGGG